MREMWELQQMQSLPLKAKIEMTRSRVKKWIDTFGEDGVYISFSGGKDSTVLLDLVRNEFGYKNVKAMFVDVPTQYPELRQFVKTFDNVDIVQPKINFFQVCEKYGFPLFSKEISECVQGARKYLTSILNEQESLTDRQTDRQTDLTAIGTNGCKASGSTRKYTHQWNRLHGWQISLVGGGYDAKYRRLQGIGEFTKRAEIKTSRRQQSEIGNHARNVRRERRDKGEYP